MSITRTYSVFCDVNSNSCVGWVAQTVEGAKAARIEAKAHGWKRIKGKDVCPRCQEARPA